ncbi:MAG: ribosome maturation factor RimP [Candidatus Geothermincolia bacterium]
MKRGDLYARVVEATRDLMRGLSLEVVDVNISRDKGRAFLRISIDREGGVTLDDCAGASEMIGQVLERENVIDGPYVLEVMSPGLDRPLRRRVDYEKSVGKRVKVNLRQPFEGESSYGGILRDAGEDTIRLDLGQEQVDLNYELISSARLDPELPW